jgi:6-phosphogluconolactonase
MDRHIQVLPSKAALVDAARQLIVERARAAIAQRGRFTIALAGGGTPKPLYEALAKEELPWEQVWVFWGDERYVPPTHPDSNEGMARQAWLNHVPIPADHIYPMPTDAADPAIAAQRYNQQLLDVLQPAETVPSLDVILLGMGDDGHTASLFPHTDALTVSDRLITVGNKDGQPRITFTAPLINQAACVLFLVAGASKQPALAHVFADVDDDATYPSRLIRPQGELWWLLDEAAAGGLPESVG